MCNITAQFQQALTLQHLLLVTCLATNYTEKLIRVIEVPKRQTSGGKKKILEELHGGIYASNHLSLPNE